MPVHTAESTTPQPNTVPIPEAVLSAIESQWIERAKTQGCTKGAKYDRAEVEFFCGALAGILAMEPAYFIPPRWYIAVLRGDRIIDAKRFA